MAAKKDYYFVNRIFRRFFVPSLLSSVGLSLGGITDSLVIGNRLGAEGLSAVSFATPVYMIFNIFSIGLSVGGSIHYVRKISKGEAEEGVRHFNRIFQTAVGLSTIIGFLGILFRPQLLLLLGTHPSQGNVYEYTKTYITILFLFAPAFFLNFIFFYFVRNDDNPKLASFGLVMGNLVDIVLNYLLVIGLDMGISGTVYATVIGKLAAISLFLPHFFQKDKLLGFCIVPLNLKEIKVSFLTGFVSSSQYVYQFIWMIVFNHVLMEIGGSIGVAVFNVIINLSYVVLSAAEGTSGTLQPMTSTFYGEHNIGSIKSTLRLSLKWGMFFITGLTGMVFLGAGPLCTLFGLSNPWAAGLGIWAIRLYCISVLLAGLNVIMASYYQSVNQEKTAFISTILRSFVLFLGFGLLFSILGIKWFWLSFLATEAGTLFFILLVNLRKKEFYRLKEFDSERIYSIILKNEQEDLSAVTDEIEAFCEKWEADVTQTYYVNLTVEEICSVIMQHAFGKGKEEYIQLTLVKGEGKDFILYVRDSASHFNPFSLTTRKIQEDNEEGLDGVGILLVKKKAKDFHYRRYAGFNTLMIKV